MSNIPSRLRKREACQAQCNVITVGDDYDEACSGEYETGNIVQFRQRETSGSHYVNALSPVGNKEVWHFLMISLDFPGLPRTSREIDFAEVVVRLIKTLPTGGRIMYEVEVHNYGSLTPEALRVLYPTYGDIFNQIEEYHDRNINKKCLSILMHAEQLRMEACALTHKLRAEHCVDCTFEVSAITMGEMVTPRRDSRENFPTEKNEELHNKNMNTNAEDIPCANHKPNENEPCYIRIILDFSQAAGTPHEGGSLGYVGGFCRQLPAPSGKWLKYEIMTRGLYTTAEAYLSMCQCSPK